MRTRGVSEGDAREVARLCSELGYPASEDRVRRRIRALNGAEDHELLVAQDDGGEVTGWVHARVTRSLQADPVAEVLGLVVGGASRGGGVGRLLMAEVERWAETKGCGEVRLRSNVVREGAHRFYEGLGYEVRATSLVFRKELAGRA